MKFIVIEKFRNRDPRPVYSRFRERGRLAPAGLIYVGSWVSEDLSQCVQIMECDDRSLLDEWISQWDDIVDFEIIPALSSAEAAEAVAGLDQSDGRAGPLQVSPLRKSRERGA